MIETVEKETTVTVEKSNRKIERAELIQFLAENLYNDLQYKMTIKDKFLRGCHLRAKAIGEDLFFLTVSFYQQKGLSTWKHNMSDFVTKDAKKAIESGEKLGGKLIFEHLVPKNIYSEKLKDAVEKEYLSKELVFEILNKYYYTCTMTVEEDSQLGRTTMPEGWDGEDAFYRYKKAGIIFEDNLHNYRAKDKNNGCNSTISSK